MSCIEEIAYRNGWIAKDKPLEIAQPMLKTDYGKCRMSLSLLKQP